MCVISYHIKFQSIDIMNGASFILFESSIESKVIVKFFMNAINYKYLVI